MTNTLFRSLLIFLSLIAVSVLCWYGIRFLARADYRRLDVSSAKYSLEINHSTNFL